MKNSILILPLLLLGYTSLLGQRTVLKDSLSLEWNSQEKIWYSNVRTDYSKGFDIVSLPVGDSNTVVSNIVSKQLDYARTIAHYNSMAMKTQDVIRKFNQQNNELQRNQLPNLDTTIQSLFEGQFIKPVSIRLNGSSQKISGEVVKNAQGNLRLLYNNVGYRVVVMAETWIRLIAYPTQGQSVNLFRVNDLGVFSSFDGSIIVEFPQ